MEGIVTVICGRLTPFILTNTPANPPTWMTGAEAEARFLVLRSYSRNGGEDTSKHSVSHYFGLSSATGSSTPDVRLNTVPIYGTKFTLPQIVKEHRLQVPRRASSHRAAVHRWRHQRILLRATLGQVSETHMLSYHTTDVDRRLVRHPDAPGSPHL